MKLGQELFPRVVDAVRLAGSENIEYFGGLYDGGYRLQQSPEEFARLVCILAGFSPFNAYLEIGTAAGGTIRFLNDWIQFGRNVIIDDGKHYNAHVWREQNRHGVPNVTEFIGDSHSTEAPRFLQELGIQFDLVAIDGDHSYEGVSADWQLTRPYVRPGGLVWFHDIRACPGVTQLWKELRDLHTPILETDQLGIGLLRVK